jgi:hypothetical protein
MGLLSLDEAGGLGGVVPEAIGVDYARFEVSKQVDKETSKTEAQNLFCASVANYQQLATTSPGAS